MAMELVVWYNIVTSIIEKDIYIYRIFEFVAIFIFKGLLLALSQNVYLKLFANKSRNSPINKHGNDTFQELKLCWFTTIVEINEGNMVNNKK